MKNTQIWLWAVLILAGFVTLSGCNKNGGATETAPVTEEKQTAAPAAVEEPTSPAAPEAAASVPTEPAGNPVVVLQTGMGEITIELWPEKAPATVENFLTYVRDGFFDGTIFHRVIKGFMIQGGGFTPEMQQKSTRAPIRNEAAADVPNERGTIAMARTSAPHSATSQFFINHVNNAMLNYSGPANPGYAVFGKVIGGMDVVDAIANVPTTTRAGHQNVPAQPVVIEKATIRNQ